MSLTNGVDYGYDVQKVYLELFLSDATSFVRCQSIFDYELFHPKLRPAAEFVFEYVNQFKDLPPVEIVNANTKEQFRPLLGMESAAYAWLLTSFETFIRHKGMERAIIKSNELLENGDYGTVEDLIKKAVQVGLTQDLGTSYYDDPRQRLMKLKESNGQIKSGWKQLDEKLYGGFNYGELAIFCANSGGGKSVMLANLAVNWSQAGYTVLYLTFELSEALVAMRIDSMSTGIPARNIFANMDDVEIKVKSIGRMAGTLQIKYMPTGKNVNDLKGYVKEFEIQTGKKVDVLLVDYMDLLVPISKRIDVSNLNIKDKYVSEELRNFAMEHRMVVVSASQLNRSSVEEVEFNHSHISGGISKIQSADNVFAILLNKGFRERGKMQIQFLKTRNSAGVGSNIELDYDVDIMRITDDDASVIITSAPASINEVVNGLKRRPAIDVVPERVEIEPAELPAPSQGSVILPALEDKPLGTEKAIKAETTSSRLRGFLNNGGL